MSTDPSEAEIAQLRARVAMLEAELLEQQRRANAAVAAAQRRVYWLDRWHLDLDRLVRGRGGALLRIAGDGGLALHQRLRRLRQRRGGR